MALLNQAILVARIFQITLALIAFSVAIAACKYEAEYQRNDRHGWTLPHGYHMMAAIMTLFDNAALGVVGILAALRPQDLARWLMVIFDVLAVAAAIAAGKCITEATNFGADVFMHVAIVFAYLSAVPPVLPIASSVYLLYSQVQSGADLGQIRLPEEPRSTPTMEEVRSLNQRVEQLEAEARNRS